MKIPKAPDLGSPRRLAISALIVTLIMGAVLAHLYWGDVDSTLGDTDDATRLVLVRGLLSGQGWWDQHIMRLQPPVGLYMHWSRLLDGALAGFDKVLQLFLSADDAEDATRFFWPLLWIFPASLAAMAVAKRLGAGALGGAVVLICAVILASDTQLFIAQFHPGRIDHHNIQIVMCMLALAGAVQTGPGVGGAVLAGVATGLGSAVGLEALVFEAVIGAALALQFALRPHTALQAQAYGAALGLTAVVAFGVQTPPWRWGVMACDALALNLVGALAVGAVGLVLAAALTAKRPLAVRLGALILVGAAAGATYLGLYPNCRHGFFADVDPRIRGVWLNFVNEVRPIDKVWRQNKANAVEAVTPWVIGLAAWIGLGFRRARRTDIAWLLTGACLIVGVATGAAAGRMAVYPDWFAVPGLAAAAGEVASLLPVGGLLAALLAGAVATPTLAEALTTRVTKLVDHKPAKPAAHAAAKPVAKPVANIAARPATTPVAPTAPGKPAPPAKPAKLSKVVAPPAPSDHCFDTGQFDDLSNAGPPGLVLAEVDLGPFILANSDDSALAAPYHRMGYGIMKAYGLLSAPADGAGPASAQTRLRQAGVAYVLECKFHLHHGDRDKMSKDSLQKRLDAGKPPAWLIPLSPATAALQAYRVKPVAPTAPTVAEMGSKAGR
ncbi:MAG: hypothetical protein ACYDD1_13930 [Caulobacteraceae bacterium]